MFFKKDAKKNSEQSAASAVRVLRDFLAEGAQYKCDQVVVFPPLVLSGLLSNGSVDEHPDAVAYCTDVLGAEIIVHESPVQAADEGSVD